MGYQRIRRGSSSGSSFNPRKVDADDAGNIYLTWGESYDGDVAVYVAGSQDDGLTWTEKVRVDNATTGKVFPVVTAGADGRVAVAYCGSQGAPGPAVLGGGSTSVFVAVQEEGSLLRASGPT